MSQNGLDTQVILKIESVFDKWDAEFEKREEDLKQHFADTLSLDQRLNEQAEKIESSLEQTSEKFDTLLNLLDKEHVIFPSGENLNEKNYEKIIGLSKFIYEEAMLALHLIKDYDALRKFRKRINTDLPPDSLKKKIKAHFILAEIYIALGVRINPSIEDRSARAEYLKVTTEGEHLYQELKDQDNGILARIRLSHDIGASYKRLYDLFEEADKSGEYGYIKRGDRVQRHNLITEARKWYNEMFDIQNTNPNTFFDAKDIFPTEYEFKRYLHDLEELNTGCFFQNYAIEPIKDSKTGKTFVSKFFNCSKTGEACIYNQDHCTYLEETREHENIIARVEVMRNLI